MFWCTDAKTRTGRFSGPSVRVTGTPASTLLQMDRRRRDTLDKFSQRVICRVLFTLVMFRAQSVGCNLSFQVSNVYFSKNINVSLPCMPVYRFTDCTRVQEGDRSPRIFRSLLQSASPEISFRFQIRRILCRLPVQPISTPTLRSIDTKINPYVVIITPPRRCTGFFLFFDASSSSLCFAPTVGAVLCL